LLACLGKHTDAFIEQLVVNSEGKTDCNQLNTDDWGGYERVLSPEIAHYIGKDKTQRLERTNGTLRQQTGRWHRRQNQLGQVWEQTNVTVRLVVGYFNWIWKHSRFKPTAAQRAGLTTRLWNWHDIASYLTLI
jgi:IS1 family transposase